MSQIHLNNYDARSFQLWEYHVSHGQALIRSPKSSGGKNIDLKFLGVEFLSIPRHMNGISIVELTPEDVEFLSGIYTKELDLKKITVILSCGKRYFVVSSSCRIEETDCDIFDSPFS